MLDFNKPLLSLNGVQVVVSDTDSTPVTIGRVLADLLSKSQSDHPVKNWDWCLKMYNGSPIDLDPTDLDILAAMIGKLQSPDFIKAQALLVIREAKNGQ